VKKFGLFKRQRSRPRCPVHRLKKAQKPICLNQLRRRKALHLCQLLRERHTRRFAFGRARLIFRLLYGYCAMRSSAQRLFRVIRFLTNLAIFQFASSCIVELGRRYRFGRCEWSTSFRNVITWPNNPTSIETTGANNIRSPFCTMAKSRNPGRSKPSLDFFELQFAIQGILAEAKIFARSNARNSADNTDAERSQQ
jgi:hypothetical protein